MTFRLCIDARCDELVESPQSRCPAHRKDSKRGRRGRDAAWDRVSRIARSLQDFCLDCGRKDDLTADHLPIAWERKAQGLPILLQDIEVVCRSCNGKRGAARGPNARQQTL